MDRTALVIGSTGLVGAKLLNLLLNDKENYYSTVISVSRKQLDIQNEKLVQLVIDFDKINEIQDLLKATDVYCCLGTTMKKARSKEAFYKVDYNYPWEFARRAVTNGSKQFLLVSAMGANRNSGIFYNKVKGEIEDAIQNLGFDAIDIFRPSLLLGDRVEQRKGEKIAKSISTTFPFLFYGPLKKYKPIQAETVALAMFATAKKNLQGINIFESNKIGELASGKLKI